MAGMRSRRRGCGQHPWQYAFDAAVDHDELGEFSPWWIYPGDARVERLIVHFPLSREDAQYERLRESLTLYRMMLGQPRQEDMMELLRQRGVTERQVAQLDCRPPPRQDAQRGLEVPPLPVFRRRIKSCKETSARVRESACS